MIKFNNLYNVWYLLYIALIFILYILTLIKILPEVFIHVPLIMALIPISYKALQKLKEKKIGTEVFLTIATIISLIGDQEKAMSVVLFIMLIAEYLEQLISARTEQEIKSLINLIPQEALVKINTEEKVIPISEIKPGMLVIIKTGARIPVDGTITQGTATINEASLTGESTPQEKGVSQQIFAGTFVEAGSIIIKTEKVGADTFFGKISALVQQAEQKKAKISILTDKIAFYLVPTLLTLIGLTWLVTKDLNLVTTLLVFGSPLELTLITPLAILSGIIAAFRNGILVKGGLVLEKFSKADTIIFDKTGTLTSGEPEVTKIELFDPKYTEKELLTIAAIAEKWSDHVLAKALLKKAQEEGITVPDPENYISLSGHGVEITYNNEKWFLGNRHFIEAPEHGNITVPGEETPDESAERSSFYIGCAQKLYGKIYITDNIRRDAKQTITDLKKMGLKDQILLSGDKQAIVTHIASLVGIPVAYGEVFPDQKLLKIENLQNTNHIVAMVGDGINDAPALKQADIGIAMGAMGMEPAIEAADIVLITNNLYQIVFVYALSKKIFKVIQQNLLIGFALIHGIGIVLTFLGYLDPLKAALFHGVSDIAILLNSARLVNFKL
jgi:heavy metal translocating P-type ATPase